MLTEMRTAERGTAAPSSKTVLVVDDQPLTLALTARMLRSLGYTVLTTDTPASAVVLVEGGAQVDCVVTDLTMPGMSGEDLATRLAAVEPRVPVVFMSGYPEQLSLAMGEGGSRLVHLEKPFTIAALHVAVREAIG